MPAPTPGYVKNMIRRSLREIVEPSPNKKDINKIWEFFDSECAYCGRKLNRKNKEGHIDHLVSASAGGANHVSNRVLSCANCNEKEKLDMPWEEFLFQKNSDKNLANKRRKKILQWQKVSGSPPNQIDAKILHTIESKSNEVIGLYDKKVQEIRKLLKNNNL